MFEILAVLRPVVSTSVSAQTQRCVSGSDAACQACSSFRPAWSSQPQPSVHSWDHPQTAITISVSLCLPSFHHPSPCPSSLAIGVWTSELGKWQEESTKLTRQMSFGSVFYSDMCTWQGKHFFFVLFPQEKFNPEWFVIVQSSISAINYNQFPHQWHQQTLKGLCCSMRPIRKLLHVETRK